MKRWQFWILIFELALFAAILILPQVALPAFAFHEGMAPVAAHARVCDSPAVAAIAVAPIVVPEPSTLVRSEIPEIPPPVLDDARLSLLCVLIC